jgi:transcriptional regulator with XRE-family HTH domain
VTDTPNDFFAERIRALRVERGWSQTDVAERLDGLGFPIYQTIVHKLESGKQKATVEQLAAFAGVFRVSPSYLLPPVTGTSTDLDRAVVVARSVLPGPIGEAVSELLSWQLARDPYNTDIHLLTLAARIVDADRVRKAVSVVVPELGDDLHYGLAARLLSERDVVKTVDEATRLAEVAVRYLISMAPYVHPDGDESRDPVNLVGHVLMLTAVNRQLRADAEASA